MTWLINLIQNGTTELSTRDGVEVTQLTYFEGVRSEYCVFSVVGGLVKRWTANGLSGNDELVPPRKRFFHCTDEDKEVGDYGSGEIYESDDYESLSRDWVHVQEVTIEPVIKS